MQHALFQRTSFYVIASAVLTALLFHFTLAERIRGFGVSLFFLVLILAVHGLFLVAKIKPNAWSYVFLVPMVFSMTALSLYANDQAQLLGFLIATVSFMLFAYWSTAPVPRWDLVQNFFPGKFFRETLLPFGVSASPFQGHGEGKRWRSVGLGFVLAVPIVFIFMVLFASADQLFGNVLSDLFSFHGVSDLFAKGFWDIVIFLMISHAGWLVWTRVIERRMPQWKERDLPVDETILNTVLTVLNVLFLVFVGFQFVYFFAGHDYVQSHELVYSVYMRQGFNQLLFAAALILGGTLLVHRLTHFRSKLTKGMCAALIAETFVILVSAGKRLWLYVDAYHLSIQRYWGFVVLIFVSLMLAWYLMTLILQKTWSAHFKQIVVATLCFFSAVLLLNQNNIIARWNLTHVAGEFVQPDLEYLVTLLPDAAPAIQEADIASDDVRKAYKLESPVSWLSSTISDFWVR